ncbi:DUF257 family protein [Thermococcus sp. Bubb.Bath]|uniref:DUF257 family protein n=1 Tax=Thermococcus sp. Bubb.Bath TaxID=1638242 RepID=UPI001438B3BD|nr:DUF257 family protein [Thermococcus sp. Bubb.Bath]NJF24642.1 hypothetical protein [Thermococcus sp. Bubb.Bath]
MEMAMTEKMEKFEASLFDYAETLKRGEDVLIEYTSNEPIHLFFQILMKYLKEKGRSFVIVDALDQLHVFKTHLALVGIDTGMIDNARVIKLGGALETGDVLGRVDLEDDIPVWKSHYDEFLKEVQEGYHVRLTVGLGKVLVMYEKTPEELEKFFGLVIRPYLGDKKRSSVYFINTDLINEKTLKELREQVSRVFDVELAEGEITLKILKSIDFSEYGRELKIRAQELQEYLAGQP